MAGGADGGLSLPAVLRPYCVLLFDGFGGANAQRLDYVCSLTPKQVAGWYAGPMGEARRQAEAKPVETPELAGSKGMPTTRAEFVGKFAKWYGGKPQEWWDEKWEQWQQNQRG